MHLSRESEGLLVTGGDDKKVHVWGLRDPAPVLVSHNTDLVIAYLCRMGTSSVQPSMQQSKVGIVIVVRGRGSHAETTYSYPSSWLLQAGTASRVSDLLARKPKPGTPQDT